jgi:ribonucleoside-diphosphate reductase alpha chain
MFKIITDSSRDSLLTDFGKQTLRDRYLLPGESFQDLFARIANAYASNEAHAQRLYDYMSRLWFMPSTPVLANGGTSRGLPISCFLNSVGDSLEEIVGTWNENVWLASGGGGIGTYWGHVRAVGEGIGARGDSSGIMPFLKVMDSQTLAISQGSLRRGSAAVYLPVDHPEIEEFIQMRRATGGDPNRRCLNLHHGIVIPDAFMRAVEDDSEWQLKSPVDDSVRETISARSLWIRILSARVETGEPYLYFIDTVNTGRPEVYKKNGTMVETSNLCNEITLSTGRDHLGNDRTAVCCLSSLNLEYFLEWQYNPLFIADVMRFLDNVLQDFINRAPDDMGKAKYSALRERSIGLGVMGFHSFLQKNNVPFESVSSIGWNKLIFRHIRKQVDAANIDLAYELGACPDAIDAGIPARFTHVMSIAPTASISIIAGGASPCIEPWMANGFAQKTLSGSFIVRNPYLQKILQKHGKDTQDVWAKIAGDNGSVANLDFLDDRTKEVFKTAIEINQNFIVKLAADRQEFIDQSQSVNLFFPANVSKKELHDVHMKAWKSGMKGLYYCRSMAIQRAEHVSKQIAQKANTDECEVCQ